MKLKTSFLSVVCVLFLSFQANASLVCPSDVWLNCGAEIWDLTQYGQAYFYHAGHQYSAGQPEVSYHVSNCETGYIQRTWRYEDYNWVWHECTQTIYISGGHFDYHNIHWPYSDLQLYGCNVNTHPDNLPYGYGRPTFDYMTCSMVGTSYKDQVFSFGADCKKILRTWTVLDWCNYGNSYGHNPGIWTFVQTIKISNTEQPDLYCTPEVVVNSDDCNYSHVNVPYVGAHGDACYGGYEIENDSHYAYDDGADASGSYPVGTTRVNYTVKYACGSEMYCHTDVVVKDKAPVPYCLATLNVVLMPVDTDADGLTDNGMVEVWAKDLDYGSYHPCNSYDLKFSFSSDITNTFRTFTCAEAGYNDVELWVTDHYGRQSFCRVQVIVQNNAANIPNCEEEVGNKVINGLVTNQFSAPLTDVYVNVRSKGYNVPITIADTTYEETIIDSFYNVSGTLLYLFDVEEVITYTQANSFKVEGKNINLETSERGKFGTDDLDVTRQYSMTAYKTGDMTMIDEADVEYLRAYVEDRTPFINSYSYIAADINEDNQINQVDLDLLTELYTGAEDEWPNEKQWVFYNQADMENMSDNPLKDNMEQKIILRKGEFYGKDFSFMGILKGDLSSLEQNNKSAALNIESRDRKESFSVYPNPFTETMLIKNNSNENVSISVFNTEGKLFYQKDTDKSEIQIQESSSWSQGTYIISVKSSTGTDTYRIVKI